MRPSAPQPAVRQDNLPEVWGLGAARTWRVGYINDEGQYVFVRYAATNEVLDHFAAVTRARKPGLKLVIERLPVGVVLRPCDPPLPANVFEAPTEAKEPRGWAFVQPQLG